MTDRRVGLGPVTAAEQLQAQGYDRVTTPIALPAPYAAALVEPASVGIAADATKFLVFGDHGGVKAPGPQNAVSVAMQDAVANDPEIKFVLSLGDIVYFNGDPSEYSPQFSEPYSHLNIPFIAIPGNHDGDNTDGVAGSGISSFMANWCTSTPQAPPGDPSLEFGRHTQTQPSHDWAIHLDDCTIIGLWSNVPSGGHLTDEQQAFLVAQLKAAPDEKPLLLAVHHPPFSCDAMHGGCAHLSDMIDSAVKTAGSSWPTMVLSGHVHDCQRFTRLIDGATFGCGSEDIGYLVSGNGGYHNLHQLASGAEAGENVGEGITFEYGDADRYGFWIFELTGSGVEGTYTAVTPGAMPDGSDCTIAEEQDSFTYV